MRCGPHTERTDSAVERADQQILYFGRVLLQRTDSVAGVVDGPFDTAESFLDTAESFLDCIHSLGDLALIRSEGIDRHQHSAVVRMLGLERRNSRFDFLQ